MDEKALTREAFRARERSYSPYSNYRVEAALLARSGRVYHGCNIENASFSPTNCAERTAFFKEVSEGETEFEAVAVVGAAREASVQEAGQMLLGAITFAQERPAPHNLAYARVTAAAVERF